MPGLKRGSGTAAPVVVVPQKLSNNLRYKLAFKKALAFPSAINSYSVCMSLVPPTACLSYSTCNIVSLADNKLTELLKITDLNRLSNFFLSLCCCCKFELLWLKRSMKKMTIYKYGFDFLMNSMMNIKVAYRQLITSIKDDIDQPKF